MPHNTRIALPGIEAPTRKISRPRRVAAPVSEND
jgi:hypothetical protein